VNVRRTFVVVSLVALMIVMIGVVAAQNAIGTVTGLVSTLERIALPEDAEIVIELVDVSAETIPSEVLVLQVIRTRGRQVPFAFALNYDTGSISEGGSYAINARIYTNGSLSWINDTPALVITNGEFAVDMTLVQVTPSETTEVSGTAIPSPTPSGVKTQTAAVDDPAAVVQAFFEALYTGEDPSPFVCGTMPEVADAYRQAADAMAEAFADATVDLSGLTYTVTDEEEDRVAVEVGGEMMFTVSGFDTAVPFPTISITVTNDDGTWKVCG
jgi:putative lipoprotein